MNVLNSGRIRQTYALLATCVGIFALLLLVIPGMSVRMWLWIMAAALVASVVCVVLFQIWLGRVFARRDSAIELLHRITAGNLDLDAAAIRNATQSTRMSVAVRALVTTLERTIRRFAQLATDVTTVSQQISGRSRVMAKSVREQLTSTEVTSASVTQIDTSINTVRNSMEQLSANAEETSTSVLEMSASIEEVGRIADTLSEFVEQTGSAIEEMVASINEVATNTESFSSFAVQTASSMVQMNATTEEIGRSTKQSSELARYVRDAANEGREAVSGTVDGMRRIQQAVDEAKMALSELAERSRRSERSCASSTRSPGRPTCWRSMPPSSQRRPASVAKASLPWRTRSAISPSAPRCPPTRSAHSFRTCRDLIGALANIFGQPGRRKRPGKSRPRHELRTPPRHKLIVSPAYSGKLPGIRTEPPHDQEIPVSVVAHSAALSWSCRPTQELRRPMPPNEIEHGLFSTTMRF